MHNQEQLQPVPSQFRRAIVVTGVAALAVGITSVLLQGHDVLYREGGILETLAVVLWASSIGLCGYVALGVAQGQQRSMVAWMGIVALLAMLRELDMDNMLNPDKLGAWGVRYRLDWWLNGNVNPLLKLGWGALFLTVGGMVLCVPIRQGQRWWQSLRRLEPAITFMAIAVLFLVLGAAIDDLLRKATFIPLSARQLVEETSETFGAAWFLASVQLHQQACRKSGA